MPHFTAEHLEAREVRSLAQQMGPLGPEPEQSPCSTSCPIGLAGLWYRGPGQHLLRPSQWPLCRLGSAVSLAGRLPITLPEAHTAEGWPGWVCSPAAVAPPKPHWAFSRLEVQSREDLPQAGLRAQAWPTADGQSQGGLGWAHLVVPRGALLWTHTDTESFTFGFLVGVRTPRAQGLWPPCSQDDHRCLSQGQS